MSDSEDDILEDTIEVTNDDPDIGGDKNEHILSVIEKKETLSEEAILFDKVGKQLYEFVGDQKFAMNDYDLMDATKKHDELENNDQNLTEIESDEMDNEDIGKYEKAEYLEDKIGNEFIEFVGEPEETIESINIAENLSSNELSKSNIVPKENKKFKCSICSKMFSTKYFLVRHQRHHMGDTPYKCNKCTKTFTRKYGLKKHKMVHTGEKPFQCTTCSKRFKHQFTLKTHIMIHTGTHPYPCQSCGKGFSSLSKLTIHERIHTGERPYYCKTCSKSFMTNLQLNRHEMIHTNEKPFQCHTCEKCFNRHDLLKQHEIIHTDKKPFQCNTCKKCFNKQYSLTRHEKIHTRHFLK